MASYGDVILVTGDTPEAVAADCDTGREIMRRQAFQTLFELGRQGSFGGVTHLVGPYFECGPIQRTEVGYQATMTWRFDLMEATEAAVSSAS